MGKGQDHALSLEAELLTSVKKRKGTKKNISEGSYLVRRINYMWGSRDYRDQISFLSVKDANCYIELGENMREVSKGAKVKVLPFTLTSEYYEQ